MQISFSPMRRDDRPELSVAGDVLTVNGEDFDFSGVPDGATLPRGAVACDWLASDVERTGGGAASDPDPAARAQSAAGRAFSGPVVRVRWPRPAPGSQPISPARGGYLCPILT